MLERKRKVITIISKIDKLSYLNIKVKLIKKQST